MNEKDMIIEEIWDDDDDCEENMVDIGGMALFLGKIRKAEGKGVWFRNGYAAYEEDGEYEPDFSVTAIYPEGEEDPEALIYWEQDGPAVTIHNFLRIVKDRSLDIASMDPLGKAA